VAVSDVEMTARVTKSCIGAAFVIACADLRQGADDPPAERATHVAPAETKPAERAPPEAPSTVREAVAGASAADREPPAQAQPAPSTEPREAGADTELAPPLLAADGTPLPQTQERPRADAVGLQQRLVRLVEAIAQDDPERALPAFFPRSAYERVKAVADPGRDWQQRLVRAFERDIHDYHRMLGPDAAGAQLDGLVVNERAVRWMEPGAEGNRLGYYRVTRARLRLRLPAGARRELELTSLISWRGAWYIVHLHGFS
jgi:hypothetical protein